MQRRQMNFEDLLRRKKQFRSVGFDDTPWRQLKPDVPVNFVGAICSSVRFEGMLWGSFNKDGTDITEKMVACYLASKFLPQLHLILLEGITFGGCNVIDLPQLSERTGIPAVTVMRKHPDLEAFKYAVELFSESNERWRLVKAAGEIHNYADCFYQVAGAESDIIGRVLEDLTDQRKVPGPFRLAHLVGSAVMLGQSGKRA